MCQNPRKVFCCCCWCCYCFFAVVLVVVCIGIFVVFDVVGTVDINPNLTLKFGQNWVSYSWDIYFCYCCFVVSVVIVMVFVFIVFILDDYDVVVFVLSQKLSLKFGQHLVSNRWMLFAVKVWSNTGQKQLIYRWHWLRGGWWWVSGGSHFYVKPNFCYVSLSWVEFELWHFKLWSKRKWII